VRGGLGALLFSAAKRRDQSADALRASKKTLRLHRGLRVSSASTELDLFLFLALHTKSAFRIGELSNKKSVFPRCLAVQIVDFLLRRSEEGDLLLQCGIAGILS
jgi:hypothetical protein